MGRKAIDKERKPLNDKQRKWLAEILPFFYDHGMKGPTMDDIAKYLNLSKATIYNYYSSKDELVHDALWFKLVQLEKFRDALFDETIEYKERYYVGLSYFTESLKGMSAIYLNDLKVFFPKSWESVVKFREKSVENISEYYRQGVEQGVFRPFNMRMMAVSDMVFFDLILDAQFLVGNDITVDEAFEEYFTVKFNGILNK